MWADGTYRDVSHDVVTEVFLEGGQMWNVEVDRNYSYACYETIYLVKL